MRRRLVVGEQVRPHVSRRVEVVGKPVAYLGVARLRRGGRTVATRGVLGSRLLVHPRRIGRLGADPAPGVAYCGRGRDDAVGGSTPMAETAAVACSDPVIRDQWHAVAGLTRSVAARSTRCCWRSRCPAGSTSRARCGPRLDPTGGRGPSRFAPTTATCGRRWASHRRSVRRPGGPRGRPAHPQRPDRGDRGVGAAGGGELPGHGPLPLWCIRAFWETSPTPRWPSTGLRSETARSGPSTAVFYRPRAAAASSEPVLAEYVYRVPHPYSAMLYKSSPIDAERMDAIGIFIHPLTETRIRAHLFISILDDVSADREIRRFQQGVIAQGQAHPREPAPQAAAAGSAGLRRRYGPTDRPSPTGGG